MREGHITGLEFLDFDLRLLTKLFLEQTNHLRKGDGLGVSQIEDFELSLQRQGSCDAVDDVVNKRIVTERTAITKHRDFAASLDEAGKFVNGQIGPLPGAVDREEAQAYRRNGVEPRVAVTQFFPSELCDTVGRDGIGVCLIFSERRLTGGAVDGTGRGKHEP